MAQPLYVAGITAASPANTANCNGGGTGTCNMIIAVTLNDTIFAWNADAISPSSALVWSRQGQPGSTSNPPGNAGNALWYDDCGLGGGPVPGATTLPFEGILSTPVIDVSGSSVVMFVTSYCQQGTTDAWYVHEINLKTGAVVMIPVAGNLPDGHLFGLVANFSNATYYLGTGDTGGEVTTFFEFPSTDRPATPIYGADGNYYGTAYTVGAPNGYFYQVTPSGAFTKMATLPFQGNGIVLQGTDGNFYGVQPPLSGCPDNGQHGTVYKMTPAGQFTTLYDFGLCSNAIVTSLIQGSDGKLYGATQGNSVIFSLTTTGTYQKLFQTTNGVTEGLCTCILTQGSDGLIYGTAVAGGNGPGVIFALDAGLPVPAPRSQHFEPTSGAAGTNVRIWGYNLFGAAIQFNGVPATNVYNSGSNYVWATVPAGAASGPITITTAGGTATTKASFTVE